MASGLRALADYGSDDETTGGSQEHIKRIVSTEEVYAEDGEGSAEEPSAKRSRLEGSGIDSAVDSFLAEIGDDLDKVSSEREDSEYRERQSGSIEGGSGEKSSENDDNEEENIDGVEIPLESLPPIPTTLESTVIEESPRKEVPPEEIHSISREITREASEPGCVQAKKEEPEVKLPFFKLANRCANAMKSTLNVRSVQMEEYGGFRVYLRYDDIPICLLSSMGQHESEITARRSAVRELVEQMLELGLFPPNAKKILAEKITTVDKMIEVTKPVLSYLKFQLSDQRYQRMLRDDVKMSLKADCTRIQLELITILIDQIKFFTYRFYAEPTNNPWLHLAPSNSVAPSVYTTPINPPMETGSAVANEEPVYGGECSSAHIPSFSSFPSAPPPLASGMKLRIIEDMIDTKPADSRFCLPPPVSTLPSSSLGFQSQYVRTVAVAVKPVVKEETISAPIRINVPKHEVISEMVERTIGAFGWTERNDTIMVGLTRKRAYLWVDQVPIAILGSMGESEKLSEAVSSCTHELMEQLCAWSLFPLDLVSQMCRNKDHLTALLYSMGPAFCFISTVLQEPQFMSLHITQGMARVPLEAPASHQAMAISFRCRVKSFMDKFWLTHKIHIGPLIPLPKLEQWEQVYFIHAGSVPPTHDSHQEEESSVIESEKISIDSSYSGSEDAPAEIEEYL